MVSVSVSENFGIEKKYRYRFWSDFWFRHSPLVVTFQFNYSKCYWIQIFLKEIVKQSKLGAASGVIDETLVESIMTQIPNISNRNILKTLTILRKKLPKQQFKANLKKVLQHRSNLLDDLFETEFSSVVDAKGEKVMMPLTSAKHLSTLVHIVCEKRGYDEDNIKIAIGGFSP